MVSQLNLAPGRYQMRVAAGNRSGKAGSVLYDIDVPDFYKVPFAMSGVSLTSGSALQGPTMKAKDPLGDFLPGPPTATREFRSDDTLVLFAEFYENAGETRLRTPWIWWPSCATRVAPWCARAARSVRPPRCSGSGGYGFAARLPLEGLKPGLYVLHVGGQSRLGERPSASRDIAITIK